MTESRNHGRTTLVVKSLLRLKTWTPYPKTLTPLNLNDEYLFYNCYNS